MTDVLPDEGADGQPPRGDRKRTLQLRLSFLLSRIDEDRRWAESKTNDNPPLVEYVTRFCSLTRRVQKLELDLCTALHNNFIETTRQNRHI